ncbi:DUF2663 family protein [Pradoshia sp. D12]|uniref:YpbF family protein n=1 Tax=Bacillaceae TaxID=186817 RepID=UPI00080AD2B1|nr:MULTISPECIES: YpbF family protein [Bacillaceae]OCA83594.1 hypothetical protein A8L44_12250 [Bacillus sp. FJAT-27986]QFK71835.1 DUF2663 family protein [Pradoshia sp. D12]TPF73630.1 DUF2663 family protein [Bacillus sp. D12]
MEAYINDLDEHTDEATKIMLNNVVKRKRKFDHYKSRHFLFIYITLGLTAILVVYVYKNIIPLYSYSFMSMYNYFFDNEFIILCMLMLAFMYGGMLYYKKKMDKAEKEFHALRCEIIDRSKDLWKNDVAWKNRHILFNKFKDLYDINLFHENK